MNKPIPTQLAMFTLRAKSCVEQDSSLSVSTPQRCFFHAQSALGPNFVMCKIMICYLSFEYAAQEGKTFTLNLAKYVYYWYYELLSCPSSVVVQKAVN